MIGQLENFKSAQSKTSTNKQRIWTPTGTGKSGFERASMDFPLIHLHPKFQFERSANFFTIGSCFAREVEAALKRTDVNCLTEIAQIPGEFYALKKDSPTNGALNVYTPASMRDLISQTRTPLPLDLGSLQVGDEWCDMLLSGLRLLSQEEFEEVRSILNNCYSKLDDAEVVILTLGFTEAWFDTQSNIYVNRSPASTLATVRYGDRYQFHNMSAPQVIECLEQIVEEINVRTNRKASIVLTTSPVPMHATFTDVDVISANTYSKSTLLTSAVYVASKYDNVDYFPSFEMVSQMGRANAFLEDGVHVKRSVVEKIMDAFVQTYFKPLSA